MSDSESDDDGHHTSSSLSFSLSESEASVSTSSTHSRPSSFARAAPARRSDTSSVTTSSRPVQYHGFLRKPLTESHASLGRKRQERSYSDSENSYEHEIVGRVNRDGRRFFSIPTHQDYHWGRQPLWQGLPMEQIENLVAWVHHGTEPKYNSLFLDSLPAEMALLHQDLGDSSSDEPVMMRNPLLNPVNTPLPLSFLNYFMLQAVHVPEMCDGLWESFDESALVAIGMIVEEIITASLLPLAGWHALRCKQLDARPTKDEALLMPVTQVSLTHPITNQPLQFDTRNLPEDESAFVAWTLPPEEAIWKLAAQGMIPDTGTPLVRDPIRSCQPADNDDKAFHISTNKEVVAKIFKELGIDSKSNQEYRDLFLSRETDRKQPPPVPVEVDDHTTVPDAQPLHKKIRMTEV